MLSQQSWGARTWLPIVVSWEPARRRQPLDWRSLTVTEQARTCKPEEAFAVRVRWGRDETIVLYRSLAKPALRSFLGYQTRARFLIGTFSHDGVLTPIVSLD